MEGRRMRGDVHSTHHSNLSNKYTANVLGRTLKEGGVQSNLSSDILSTISRQRKRLRSGKKYFIVTAIH